MTGLCPDDGKPHRCQHHDETRIFIDIQEAESVYEVLKTWLRSSGAEPPQSDDVARFASRLKGWFNARIQ